MVRYWLARLLGLYAYLWIVSKVFLLLMLSGFFKRKYPEYHFLRHYIQPGWHCMDIGANLGYFSILMSRETGTSGKVHAIEPVRLFNEVFASNVSWLGEPVIELYPYALGGEEKKVTMSTPVKSGIFRHGLTRITEEQHAQGSAHTYEVAMKVPDRLFANLEQLDFVKCDVEGYETNIFPHFMEVLKRFRPVIQIEINTRESRTEILELLSPLGYQPYGLASGSLQLLEGEAYLEWSASDFFFIANDGPE